MLVVLLSGQIQKQNFSSKIKAVKDISQKCQIDLKKIMPEAKYWYKKSKKTSESEELEFLSTLNLSDFVLPPHKLIDGNLCEGGAYFLFITDRR